MLWTTTGGEAQKTSVVVPAAMANEGSVQPEVSHPKSCVTKKHAIIAVTCAVVACAVIAGILVGVKLFLDSTHDIVKKAFEFQNEDGKTVQEDVEGDATDNVVQYYLKESGKQTWLINDLNRNIQILKLEETEESICYVTPLSSTEDTVQPDEIANVTLPHESTETPEKVNESYDASDEAIKEKSMLGPKGEKLCDGVDTYWMTENCEASTELDDDSSSTSDGRSKRALPKALRGRGWLRKRERVIGKKKYITLVKIGCTRRAKRLRKCRWVTVTVVLTVRRRR